jgi:phage terminase small subunit
MGVPKRLTEMQKRFAEYLVFNEGRTTGADAAIAAGYSEKRARVEASELQNPKLSPLVVQYIGALREENLKKYEERCFFCCDQRRKEQRYGSRIIYRP